MNDAGSIAVISEKEPFKNTTMLTIRKGLPEDESFLVEHACRKKCMRILPISW